MALTCTPFVSHSDDQSEIEHITITNQHVIYNEQKQAQGDVNQTDASAWLSSVPGAAVNKNGATSGLAQYRGLYGDRVTVKLDGLNIIGAGPNAMDAPMSYVPNNLIDNMSVYRGVTPVSAGVDTLGAQLMSHSNKQHLPLMVISNLLVRCIWVTTSKGTVSVLRLWLTWQKMITPFSFMPASKNKMIRKPQTI